jgi:peptidoglycan/xylan/chitin deacetylase (PgdA/CDA1 family)
MPEESAHPPLILGLHKIRRGGWWDHTNVRPDQLTGILKSLIDRGYRFVDLETAVTQAQPRQIAVTIDDGYAHLSESLPPICEQFELKPHLFIPAGYVGQPNGWDYTSLLRSERHLSARQIAELSRAGVSIGSHGLSHRQLTRLSNSALFIEITESKRRLEEITGKSATTISYPFGRLNRLVMETAAEAGYSLGLGTSWPRPGQNRLALGRILIYGYDTPFSVGQKLGGVLAPVERAKQEIATFLSGGTAWFQRVRG